MPVNQRLSTLCGLFDTVREFFLEALGDTGTGERMRRQRSAMRRVTILLATLAALAACGAPATKNAGGHGAQAVAVAPASLSFPYLTEDERSIPGYREAAERAARSYVAVEIIAPGNPAYGETGGIVHRASGIVVDARGYIVTNAHIARDTEMSARVVGWDGVRRTGSVVDVSPDGELALIRIGDTGLRPIDFADSGAIERGQPAVAVGSPRQLLGVGSVGRIREPRFDQRLQYGDWGFDDAVSLDMEVESGHSGGPVVNMDGALIAMVAGYELGDTTKIPYVSPRITYAVPSNAVRRYVAEKLGTH